MSDRCRIQAFTEDVSTKEADAIVVPYGEVHEELRRLGLSAFSQSDVGHGRMTTIVITPYVDADDLTEVHRRLDAVREAVDG